MGSIADIAYRRGETTTRRCGSAARSSCRSSNASATPGIPPSPGARSPTSPTGEATTTRRCGSAARSSCRPYERLGETRSAAVTWGKIADIAYRRGDYDEALRIRREVELPVFERLGDTRKPPSPGARSPTSPTGEATTTRRCGSAARSSCRLTSASATPGPPPSPGARSRTSPTSKATTTRHCGSAGRSSCRPTSASATPGKPPSPGARSPTSPTGAGTTTRQLSCRASGWR